MGALRLFGVGLALAGLWIAGSPVATAQPPETVLIQGQLLDSGGVPIVGLRQYRVRFFDAATDGAQLGPDRSGFAMISANGLFAFAVAMPQAALEAPAVWYELALDSSPIPDGVGPGDVFPERVRVHSVPFARVAGTALQVSVSAIGDGSVGLEEFNRLAGLTGNVQTQLNAKAEASSVYTQVEIDTQQAAQDALIAQKADASTVFQWQVVTGGPVQMQANRGYVVNSPSLVSLTLPPNGQLSVGDVVRVSGMGLGGWRVGQNGGQQVQAQSLLTPDFASLWNPREASRDWADVASSADGSKLVAVVAGGRIYTSTTGGLTWIPREDPRNWRAVASSADGTKLAAVVLGGQIFTSVDSGLTWSPREVSRNWTDIASSADGSKLVACVSGGQIHTSDDSGITWTPRESNRSWFGVASSADGTRLLAGNYGGFLYTSDDSGETWTPRMTDENRTWWPMASSADGTKLIAGDEFGHLYTSADAGVTWTPRENTRAWSSAASSADGTRLAAVATNDRIYTSTDSGVTWMSHEGVRTWRCIAGSADGRQLVAGVFGGTLYLSPQGLAPLGRASTAGADGGLVGAQYGAVELQYMGNGQFMPLSFAGDLNAL